MGRARNWTKEEYEYLENNWGLLSLPTIAKNLNRSETGVLIKVQRLGLGAFLESGDYITVQQLYTALGCEGNAGYKKLSWIEKRGLPIKYKKVRNNKFMIIRIEDFWKWAEKNRDFIDFSKMPAGILGKEPEWVKQQRKIDEKNSVNFKKTPWTPYEDVQLKTALKKHKYTYLELSKMLNRTEGAIQRRICDLGLKERPVKADNHTFWTEEQYEKLTECIKNGIPYSLMADIIGKSAKAIRGRVYVEYCTENLDKVRNYIANGNFGDNRPDRPISQRNCLSLSEKIEVKNNLSLLAGLLKAEVKKHYDDSDYWQKDMCMNWAGCCTANESNCDSCTSFVRIKEQYCRICGAVIISRNSQNVCQKCKDMRKRNAQRKWARLNKNGGQINGTEI